MKKVNDCMTSELIHAICMCIPSIKSQPVYMTEVHRRLRDILGLNPLQVCKFIDLEHDLFLKCGGLIPSEELLVNSRIYDFPLNQLSLSELVLRAHTLIQYSSCLEQLDLHDENSIWEKNYPDIIKELNTRFDILNFDNDIRRIFVLNERLVINKVVFNSKVSAW